jgi:hypothetical protein
MPRRALHALALTLALTSIACADSPERPSPTVVGFPDSGTNGRDDPPGAFTRPCASAGHASGGGARATLCLSPSHVSSGTASGGGVRLVASPPRLRGPSTSP